MTIWLHHRSKIDFPSLYNFKKLNILKTCQRHVLKKELTLHNSKNEQNLALESRFAFTMRTWLCKTRLDVNYSNFFLPFEVYDNFDNLKIYFIFSFPSLLNNFWWNDYNNCEMKCFIAWWGSFKCFLLLWNRCCMIKAILCK